ncbi:MAG TPA: hypothetical protein DER64_16885 [Planctomycetaceae bacterium]|nr:hypothetical protein [Planctomycetaceae bacterium]
MNFDTNFTVPSGLSATNYMMMTIDPDAVEGDAPEIIKVTGISGSGPHTLTIVRQREGTSAQNWDAGRRVVASVTAAIYDEFLIGTDNFKYDHTNEKLGIKDTASAWSGGQPDEALHIRHSDPTIHLENTATGADCYVRANESDGSIVIEADKNDEATGTSAVLLKTANATRLTANATGVTIVGVLAKTSGTFDIEHPVLGNPMRLRHSFVEAPQADLIYRGSLVLDEFGVGNVNIDEHSGMTPGTWRALSKNPWSIVACPAGSTVHWLLNAEFENELQIWGGAPDATVNWIVISERQDEGMVSSGLVDDDGEFITEYKP